MLITISDYNGAGQKGCETIKSILAYLRKENSVHISVLMDKFHLKKDQIFKHLKQERRSEWADYFRAEIKLCNLEAKIFSEKEKAKAYFERTKEIGGSVMGVLNYFFKQSVQSNPYRTTNLVMASVLYNLCCVADFDIDDFSRIMKSFDSAYWVGADGGESFYSAAIKNGNNTAWKSFEHYKKRMPFIVFGQRVHMDFSFRVIVDGKLTEYRCTGFTEEQSVRFVSTVDDKNKKRHRFKTSKDLKEHCKNFRLVNFRHGL